VLQDSLRFLKINAFLYKSALRDLSEEELHRFPSDHSNPMIWIAGHVLNSRVDLARYLKIEAGCPWGKLFERHSRLQPAAAYPGIEEILGCWSTTNRALRIGSERLTPEELSGPSPEKLSIEVDSLGSGISFFVWHESYHIGQMGYLRKWLGYEGLVD
jgi:hypothetical protein